MHAAPDSESLTWLIKIMQAAEAPELQTQAQQVLAALLSNPQIVAAGLWYCDAQAVRSLAQHDLDERSLGPLLDQVLSTGQALRQTSLLEHETAELSIVPIWGAGEIVGALAIATQTPDPADMLRWRALAAHLGASLRLAQAQQQHQTQQQDHQDRNDQWDDFISHAVHEIKNPLASTKGYADLLLRRAVKESNESYRKGLAVISQQVIKATNLLEQLSDTSRINTNRMHIERSYADLADLVRRVVQDQQIKTELHIISAEGADESLYGMFDVARVAQIVEAMIGNAVKFSLNGGTISVRLHEAVQLDGARAATIAVSDMGIGVPPGEHELIFERFRRGSNVQGLFGGLGLGLFVARDLAQRHGGRMWIESEPEQGATSYLLLPLGMPPARA